MLFLFGSSISILFYINHLEEIWEDEVTMFPESRKEESGPIDSQSSSKI